MIDSQSSTTDLVQPKNEPQNDDDDAAVSRSPILNLAEEPEPEQQLCRFPKFEEPAPPSSVCVSTNCQPQLQQQNHGKLVGPRGTEPILVLHQPYFHPQQQHGVALSQFDQQFYDHQLQRQSQQLVLMATPGVTTVAVASEYETKYAVPQPIHMSPTEVVPWTRETNGSSKTSTPVKC